jgi:autotransporter-associated beta strand protein
MPLTFPQRQKQTQPYISSVKPIPHYPARYSSCILALLFAHSASATSLYWSGNGTTQGGAGTWDNSSSRWSPSASGPYQSNWNNSNSSSAVFRGDTAGTVTLGTGITLGRLQFDTAAYTISGNTLTFVTTGNITANQSATISSALAGTVALTKSGAGTLTLNGSVVNPVNAGLNVNGGILLADFANLATPTNFINSGNAIGLGGGILSIKGKSTGTTSQTLGNVTANAGGGRILGDKNGGTSTTIRLGTLTTTATGGSLIVGAGGTSGNSPIITTTSNKDATGIYGGRTVFFTGAANTGYDWATTSTGSSPYTLSALAAGSYTALPTSGGVSTVNYNLSTSTTLTAGFSLNTLKFAPLAVASQTLSLAGGNLTIEGGGLLITGSGNSTRISNGTLTAGNGSGAYDLIVHQFNSAGGIANGNYTTNTTVSTAITDNGGNAVAFVKSGSGSLVLNGAVTYTGKTYINAGNLVLGSNDAGGALGNGNYAGNIEIAAGANLCVYMITTAQTLSGVISGEGGLIKAFNGALNLGNNNTYSGKTWLNAITTNGGGTTTVTSLNSVNAGNPPIATSSFGRPTTVANGTIDMGGTAQGATTLKYSGPGETTDRVINFIFNGNGAGKTIDASGAGLLKFTSAFTANTVFTNEFTLTGTGGGEITRGLPITFRNFTKSGTGTWILGDLVNTPDSTGTISISTGTLVLRKGGFGNTGNATVSANAALIHDAATDAPLNFAGALAITGGTSTTIGASIGSSIDSAQINVAGNATATSTIKVNLYGNSFSTVGGGSDTYTLIQGGGTNTLSTATWSLGTVFKATNFTVGALNKTADTVSANITQVPALTTAYWKGTATSALTKIWAASNGSNDGNWSATAGGSVQSLVPGPDADVIIPNIAPAVAPTNTTLGGDLSIKNLTIADTANGLSLNAAAKDSHALTTGAGGITMNTGVPASVIAAPVVLGANQTWTNHSANALTVSGVVSGSGSLDKAGTGTVILSGFNNHTGNTTVNQGTLVLSQPTLSNNSTVTVDSGAVLQLDFTGTNTVEYLVLNGVIQPAGVYNNSNAAPYLSGSGSLNVTITDTDSDGIPDWWMIQHFAHPTGEAGDKSRAQDDAEPDGLTNLLEYQAGTNPNNPDSDADGLTDGVEVNTHLTNPLLADTDGDTLTDGAEVNTHLTNPLLADTDTDGLSDGAEINIHTTNPLLADSDNDGAGDWYEITATFTNPKNSTSKPNIIYPLPKPDATPPATNKPVKVFILMGQSNMQGKGAINPIGTPGTLATVAKQQNKFPNLLDTNGNWSARGDVKYRGVISCIGNAELTVGQGTGSTQIGPELGFGHVMGYHFDEPVIVIKASFGGQDLGFDFLAPGSPRYDEGGKTYGGYLDTARSWTIGATPPPQHVPGTPIGYLANPVGGAQNYGGKMFDDCVSQVNGILDNFATQYTQYAAQGYQIAGIGWFQGFNDTVTTTFPGRYEANLVNFINGFRSAVNAPSAPFVVTTSGFSGYAAAGNTLTVINAQLAVGDPVKYPAFAGNVKSMDTRGYWRDAADSPVPNGSQGYHYNHNSETLLLVGDAMARGMLDLLDRLDLLGNDYENWAAIYSPADLNDPNADFDKDGMTNNEERAFGLDPTSGSSVNPISVPLNAAVGTLTYTRRNSLLTGLGYSYQWSETLAPGGWTTFTPASELTSGASPVEAVTITLDSVLLEKPTLFVRVVAKPE